MNDTRTSVVGAGAAVVAGSLWAPWYAIDFGPAARQAVGAQTDQLPGVLGELTRQLLTVMRPSPTPSVSASSSTSVGRAAYVDAAAGASSGRCGGPPLRQRLELSGGRRA